MTSSRVALVAGGGIAGTAAALALARAGWQVTLVEQAPALGEVGAGLQMSPNASRVLRWLGVLDEATARAFRAEAAELRDGRTGLLVYRVPLAAAAEARWGAPYLHIHRADLLDVLIEGALSHGAEIRTGCKVEGYANRPEGVRLRLEGGEVLTGDVLIGADGIRSVLRAELNGPEQPEFSGQIAWRGTIPAAGLPPGLVAPNATVWAGPGRHLVTYYIRGGRLVNFVGVEERDSWTEESWSVAGDPDALRAAFSGWHEQVTGLLSHVTECFRWGLFTRPEQVRWADGRLALIGDAAHPMLPFMAQGAAMGLEDVAVLIRTLLAADAVPSALLAYEAERWGRVTAVQARARANGRLFHQRTLAGQLLSWGPIAAAMRLAPGFAVSQLDWIYEHDVTQGLG